MFNVGPDVVFHRPRCPLHTFENRELKLSSMSIGDGIVLTGAMAVCGTKVQDGTTAC